ncbi:MAG: FAD-dependent oxidoreductase [Saprospiraceae bacterium]
MKVVIIGNGIAGTNAARFIRKKSNNEIVMISSESEYPYSRTALMYIYMGHMKWEHTKLYEDNFWDKNRITRIYDHVNSVDFNNKNLNLKSGTTINYDKLIIASGSKSNFIGWPGQNLKGVQGLYGLQDLQLMQERTYKDVKHAVVVGGGLIGVEMAEMLHSKGIQVTFLVREKGFWNHILPAEESNMIDRHLLSHGIDLRLVEELKEIKGTDCVSSIITGSGQEIKCDFVGLTIGVSPNINFVSDSELSTNKGILVDEFLQTNLEDVYAIGDCAEMRNPNLGRKAIEAVWYTGRIMGQTVAETICGKKKNYNPGIWFNSAKFFDIEYQVYGYVPVEDANTGSLYWEHSKKNCSIRLVYDLSTKNILGFNLMGIRYRHEVCERWIKEATSLEKVLENLSLANFDPEFFDEYELELVQQYNNLNHRNVKLKKSRNLNFVYNFLNK